MNVENEIYYHVHRVQQDNQWKVGNVFSFDQNKYNKFFEYYNQNVLVSTGEYQYQELYKIMNEYAMLIRELVYEEIRLKKYPDYPSRQHCIWLCNKENLGTWLNALKEGQLEIYKVRVTGKIHKCYGGALENTNINYKLLCEKAEEYWSGKCVGDPEAKEYLLEGKVEVIEKIVI